MQANSLLAKAIRVALISSAGLATIAVGVAQAAGESGDSSVERIQVTGSRIKRTDLESANPVTVLDASDLSNQGFTNVQDALENLSATTGAVTTQSVHGFTPAATAISLRGAGANRTLTLINGKRLNQYPRALGGTSNFVDTSSIPLDAVQRIEVLQSGASAIYGADAVGGVVNIILKRDFDGFAAKYRRAGTTEGGGGSDKVSISMGSSSDRGNVSNFTEFSSNEQLKANERANFGINTDKVPYSPFSSYSSYGARIAGGPVGSDVRQLTPEQCQNLGLFYDVANKRCGYDRSMQRDLAPESTRFNNTTLFNYELMDDLTMVGRLDFSKTKSTTRIEPSSSDNIDVKVSGGELDVSQVRSGLDDSEANRFTKHFDDKTSALNGDFANAADGDYYYIRRLNGLGQRVGETNGENYYGSLGLEGSLGDNYSWDVSGNYGKSYIDVYNHGYTTYQKMFDYVTAGDNGNSLLSNIPDDALAQMSYSPYQRADSSLLNFQANITGPAFELFNDQEADFAFGAEWSKQDYNANSDSESMLGNVVGTGGSSGQGDRRFWATYGELKVPVLDELTFDLAARYDRYSDFGGNVTPSIAVEYRPTDEWLLRGSWNRVFRAPDMQRVYGNPTQGFSTVVDFKKCEELGGIPNTSYPDDPQKNTVCNELHINSTTGANPDLKPEKGYTANIGAVYGGDQLSASVDLWQWKLDDMVNQVSASRQAREYAAYESTITRDASGTITHIQSTALNLSYQEVRGIDAELGYDFDLNSLGELKLIGRSTYLLKSESQLDSVSPVDDDIDDGGLPKLKGNIVATWNYGDFTTALSGYYTGRHHGVNYKSFKESAEENNEKFKESDYEVGSYFRWNLTGTYHYNDDIDFQTGLLNMFNRGPNFDPTDSSWPHYERSLFNAVGRQWFIEASVKM
ncbi:TonB-dependent receptor [Shewanella sp. 202IG2-18]|uniref:TonB-dependent receptor plug domain-containing protein n=1 Tax=Parashewanella hymeniacidonis TaxID=2807618 RepID=UPI001960640C|nr:TonB-dependent receptor [Parashewanella hymeniacidonis]MBM7073311.1 TonB-dependent receptor [Parashewanella hymeniacidonis]